jgi:hypothetical protein
MPVRRVSSGSRERFSILPSYHGDFRVPERREARRATDGALRKSFRSRKATERVGWAPQMASRPGSPALATYCVAILSTRKRAPSSFSSDGRAAGAAATRRRGGALERLRPPRRPGSWRDGGRRRIELVSRRPTFAVQTDDAITTPEPRTHTEAASSEYAYSAIRPAPCPSQCDPGEELLRDVSRGGAPRRNAGDDSVSLPPPPSQARVKWCREM